MSKRYVAWLLAGFTVTIIPVIAFLYLIAIHVDCDQFVCIGYFILFGPMFLLGISMIIIVILVWIVVAAGKQIKQGKNESFN